MGPCSHWLCVVLRRLLLLLLLRCGGGAAAPADAARLLLALRTVAYLLGPLSSLFSVRARPALLSPRTASCDVHSQHSPLRVPVPCWASRPGAPATSYSSRSPHARLLWLRLLFCPTHAAAFIACPRPSLSTRARIERPSPASHHHHHHHHHRLLLVRFLRPRPPAPPSRTPCWIPPAPPQLLLPAGSTLPANCQLAQAQAPDLPPSAHTYPKSLLPPPTTPPTIPADQLPARHARPPRIQPAVSPLSPQAHHHGQHLAQRP